MTSLDKGAEREEAIPPEDMLHPHPYVETFGVLVDGQWQTRARGDFLCNLCLRPFGHIIHRGKHRDGF